MRIAEAKTTNVYEVVNGEIKETSLYDLFIDNASQTTSPYGVQSKWHIDETDDGFDLCLWGPSGQGRKRVESYETYDEAEEALFDVLAYDNRALFFDTLAEAEQEVAYLDKSAKETNKPIDMDKIIANVKEGGKVYISHTIAEVKRWWKIYINESNGQKMAFTNNSPRTLMLAYGRINSEYGDGKAKYILGKYGEQWEQQPNFFGTEDEAIEILRKSNL